MIGTTRNLINGALLEVMVLNFPFARCDKAKNCFYIIFVNEGMFYNLSTTKIENHIKKENGEMPKKNPSR